MANIVLLGIMIGGGYTHYALGDSFERMAPSLIFGLLLICRLVILMQVIKKEKQDLELLKEYMKEQGASEEGEEATEEQLDNENNEDKKIK